MFAGLLSHAVRSAGAGGAARAAGGPGAASEAAAPARTRGRVPGGHDGAAATRGMLLPLPEQLTDAKSAHTYF